MTESEWIDKFLNDINNGEYLVAINERPEIALRAIDKALTYGLLVLPGDIYRLTEKGHQAIEAGGFEKWKILVANQKANQHSSIHVGGNAVIGNNNSGILQATSSDSLDITQTHHPVPKEIEKLQKAKSLKISKVISGIVIALIVGLILLYIEHKTGWFNDK